MVSLLPLISITRRGTTGLGYSKEGHTTPSNKVTTPNNKVTTPNNNSSQQGGRCLINLKRQVITMIWCTIQPIGLVTLTAEADIAIPLKPLRVC